MRVVDDEPDIVYLFKEALSQIGETNVFGFTDSMEALEHFKLNALNYSLILSDFRMPTMNGLKLLKTVKTINPLVRTVLMSAFDVSDEEFEECNCVNAFLQKPIAIPDLIKIIKMHLSEPIEFR